MSCGVRVSLVSPQTDYSIIGPFVPRRRTFVLAEYHQSCLQNVQQRHGTVYNDNILNSRTDSRDSFLCLSGLFLVCGTTKSNSSVGHYKDCSQKRLIYLASLGTLVSRGSDRPTNSFFFAMVYILFAYGARFCESSSSFPPRCSHEIKKSRF